jgi:hypothetical protein
MTDSVEPIIRHRPFVRLTLGRRRAARPPPANCDHVVLSLEVDCAPKELVALYDDGNLRSTIDGVVGKVLVSPGSVVRPSELMIEVVGKHRFVVAWFPVSRLYRLQVGHAVTVGTDGASLPVRSLRLASSPTRYRRNSRRHSRR